MGSGLMKVFWDAVTSRNLAIVLLIVVTVTLGVGAALPNPKLLSSWQAMEMKADHPVAYWLGERYNSQEIATGYLFGFIGVFLILSTSLCSIDRLIKRYKLRSKMGIALPDAAGRPAVSAELGSVDQALVKRHAAGWLKKKRWRVVQVEGSGGFSLAGVRGDAGFWGSVFFHFILITALVGLVIYYFGAYRAALTFTEGQSYALERSALTNISREPVWGIRLPKVALGLMDLHSVYPPDDPWTAVDHVARFRVTRIDTGDSWIKDVKINDPLVIDGREFLLVTGGFSPRFVLRAASGEAVFDNFVALKPGEEGKDDFFVPGGQMRVEAAVHPDFVMKEGRPGTRGRALNNPVLEAAIYREGSLLYEGLIPLGGTAAVGDFIVEFPEVRRWALMEMTGEPGIGMFFVLSFFGIIGIAVRMFDPDERLYVGLGLKEGNVSLEVLPYSRHFSGLISDRARELVEHLEEVAVNSNGGASANGAEKDASGT